MKKLVNLLLSLLVLIGVLFYARGAIVRNNFGGYKQDLYVYNWGEYIDPEVIADFEDLYQINVIYETYDSNETLYAKIKNNRTRYDVIFPSEYMVDKLNQEGLLLDIDYEKLTHLDQIDQELLSYLEDYPAIPYFWGTVGIIYDETKTDLTFESWDDLWDESLKNEIILCDSAREVMGMSLASLGYSINSTDEAELKLAQQKLLNLQDNIKAVIGDEVLQLMPAGEATAALTWSGSAKAMMEENENLKYVIPEQGTNIWIDSAVIPAVCENVEGAHLFIDYLLQSDVSLKNSEYVGYSTPNTITEEILRQTDEGYDEIFYPVIDKEKFEFYINLNNYYTILYNDLFLEFKMF